jgi:hypothetical protein
MRIFLYELKKIFTVKIIAIIFVIAVLFGSITYGISLDFFDTQNYVYGYNYEEKYLTEIHDKYGDTFEKNEQEEWYVQEQQNLNKIAEELIEKEPILEKYSDYVRGVFDMESIGYVSFYDFYELDQKNLSEEEKKEVNEFNNVLFGKYNEVSMKGRFFGAVKEHFTDPEYTADNYWLGIVDGSYADLGEKFPEKIRERLEKYKSDFPANTTNLKVPEYTSMYFLVIGMFVVTAIMFLLVPYTVTDRARKMRSIQYSSKIGRKVFRIQFLAVIASAVILTFATVIIFFIPYAFAIDFGKYYTSHLGYIRQEFFMYNVTLTQYILFLTLIIMLVTIGFGCIIFLLGRHSGSYINCALKTTPFLFLFYGCMYSVDMALFAENILFEFFDYKILNIEIISASIVGFAGIMIGLSVVRGERKCEI